MGSGARLLGTVRDLNVSDVIYLLHVVVGGLHVGFLAVPGALLILTNY